MTTRVGSGAYTIAGGIGTSVAPRARNTATLAETAAGNGQTNPAAVVEEEETPARLVDEPEKQLRALRRLTSLTTLQDLKMMTKPDQTSQTRRDAATPTRRRDAVVR